MICFFLDGPHQGTHVELDWPPPPCYRFLCKPRLASVLDPIPALADLPRVETVNYKLIAIGVDRDVALYSTAQTVWDWHGAHMRALAASTPADARKGIP